MVALNPAPIIADVHPLLEIGLGLSMILLCMLIHSFGMYQVMHRFEVHWWRFARENHEMRRQVYFFYLVILILHFMQAVPDLRTAFYLAGETYTSLGNGDVLLPLGWRQLAMFITMSGLLTFGWTTGVLANIVGKTYDAQFASVRDKPTSTPPPSGNSEGTIED